MSRTVSIDEMADAINEGLKEYATLASTQVKSAVRKSAKTVKDQISANAPSRTGAYKGSWVATKQSESSQSLQMVVHAATQMELVVVSAMKGYLRRMPEKEAFKKVEAILDPKVIRLAGDDGAPMPIQSNVDGAKFAAFIDAAVADSIRELEKREDDLSKAGVTMLENVDGKSIVEQMSPQFLEFVLDAYRGLKYTR